MSSLVAWIDSHLTFLRLPNVSFSATDIVEILILAWLVYHILNWIKTSHAWTLLRGILIIAAALAAIYLLQMDTLIYIIQQGMSIVIITLVVVFQPELRKVLETLGEREILNHSFLFGQNRNTIGRFSDRTVDELVRACVEMSAERTGALIVIEQNENLHEYERTGIEIDALVTSQLLINIFEHNTPLHDGAVIVRGDRVTAATCYLPLSDNKSLSKALGTRHRAGVGVSEMTDSFTIIVSEETGGISAAYKGELQRNITEKVLRDRLVELQNKAVVQKKKRRTRRAG
ncbi:MAG: diadenylate cyclase CdaA [Lachnospiraceae bacterium]|nr:diadenylate cyclase CdaA [Lachnospiraceae bacterium]